MVQFENEEDYSGRKVELRASKSLNSISICMNHTLKLP